MEQFIKAEMSLPKLPNAVSIGRFMAEFALYPKETSNLPIEDFDQLFIQSLRIEEKEFSLPLPGLKFTLTSQNDHLILSTVIPQEKKKFGQLPGSKLDIILKIDFNNEKGWQDFFLLVEHWLEREQIRILSAGEQYSQILNEQIAQGRGFAVLENLKNLLEMDLFLLNKDLEILQWCGGIILPADPVQFISPRQSVFPAIPALSVSLPLVKGSWSETTYRATALTWYPLAHQQGIMGYLGLAAEPEHIGSIERYFIREPPPPTLYVEVGASSYPKCMSHWNLDFKITHPNGCESIILVEPATVCLAAYWLGS